MLNIVYTARAELRDAFIKKLSLTERETSRVGISFYQNGNWILAFADMPIAQVALILEEEYQMQDFFVADLGWTIDMDHELGDIILPNVFLSYNPLIAMSEITAENRDQLLGKAQFLEFYEEQKDYYVENFGLSIGGILVSGAPDNPDLAEKLMMTYEADIYMENKFLLPPKSSEEKWRIIPLIGVENGKRPKNSIKNTHEFIARNMIDTIKLVFTEEEK